MLGVMLCQPPCGAESEVSVNYRNLNYLPEWNLADFQQIADWWKPGRHFNS